MGRASLREPLGDCERYRNARGAHEPLSASANPVVQLRQFSCENTHHLLRRISNWLQPLWKLQTNDQASPRKFSK